MIAFSAGGRRAATCNAVKAPPRFTHQADRSAAPPLPREPFDDLERVVLLLLHVFIRHQPIRLAAAAHIDAHRSEPFRCEVVMHRLVARTSSVSLAIRNLFEDGGHGRCVGPGVVRQPDARCEPRPIRKRNPKMLDYPHPTRLLIVPLHTSTPP